MQRAQPPAPMINEEASWRLLKGMKNELIDVIVMSMCEPSLLSNVNYMAHCLVQLEILLSDVNVTTSRMMIGLHCRFIEHYYDLAPTR